MQNTTTDLVLGNSSSLKQEKTENILPRLTAVGNTQLPKQEKHASGLLQKILKFLRAFFSGKKSDAPKSEIVAPVIQPAILLQEKVEKPVITQVKVVKSSPVTAYSSQPISRTKYGTSLRKIAEQQFEEMDLSRATRN
jgi:hypothetical protein